MSHLIDFSSNADSHRVIRNKVIVSFAVFLSLPVLTLLALTLIHSALLPIRYAEQKGAFAQ